MLEPTRAPMEEMPQEGMPQQGAGEAQENITGLLGATQFLDETIQASPAVPPELKQEVSGATQQYVTTISKVLAGSQGEAQPMETIEGAQPVAPQGV